MSLPDSDRERELQALLPALAEFQRDVTGGIEDRKQGWYRLAIKVHNGHVVDVRTATELTHPVEKPE